MSSNRKQSRSRAIEDEVPFFFIPRCARPEGVVLRTGIPFFTVAMEDGEPSIFGAVEVVRRSKRKPYPAIRIGRGDDAVLPVIIEDSDLIQGDPFQPFLLRAGHLDRVDRQRVVLARETPRESHVAMVVFNLPIIEITGARANTNWVSYRPSPGAVLKKAFRPGKEGGVFSVILYMRLNKLVRLVTDNGVFLFVFTGKGLEKVTEKRHPAKALAGAPAKATR